MNLVWQHKLWWMVPLLVAMVVPGMSLAVYALVIAWSAALYFLGPKLSKKAGSPIGWGCAAP